MLKIQLVFRLNSGCGQWFSQKMVIEVEIEIDVPVDIVQDVDRIKPSGKSFGFELVGAACGTCDYPLDGT
jgi:hypothetical protein